MHAVASIVYGEGCVWLRGCVGCASRVVAMAATSSGEVEALAMVTHLALFSHDVTGMIITCIVLSHDGYVCCAMVAMHDIMCFES